MGYSSLCEADIKTIFNLLMPLGLVWARARLLVAVPRQHWLEPEVTELLIRLESRLQRTILEKNNHTPLNVLTIKTYTHKQTHKKGLLSHHLHIYTFAQNWVPGLTVRLHSTTQNVTKHTAKMLSPELVFLSHEPNESKHSRQSTGMCSQVS